ncbi:zf-C3HC4-domain-containing protein [Fomitopsis serialis]|uniref:zf-C3HC4-domain-containing protein n=1 Tax=Fomitopsis serialis TaxID=139415 RepID=UPI002007E305|nr:zf-C3HC4-domain-containing protein [Neoantrodia serialis]KAH9937040.1 zf-C3HC4-domain-containing protein [Neoantrodia serialis]
MADSDTHSEKQCRICFEGEDPQLGRLIRPCLCKGSMSHVHVKCLQRWRNTAANQSAFYSCPQCGYRYHFVRTRVVGIATNPVVIAAVSSLLFTVLVLCSSFITTSLLSDDGDSILYSYGFYNPLEVIQNLVRATVNIFIDDRLLDETVLQGSRGKVRPMHIRTPAKPPGFIKRLVRRFLLGLPVVGAGSIAHMLLSIPLPFHWLRLRGYTRGRDSRDFVALLMVAVVLMGAARALYKVYKLTEKLTKRLLLRAEDVILEV